MAGMTPSTIANSAKMAIDEASGHGRFLVTIFHVEPGTPAKIVMRFEASDFPHGDYNTCIRLLRNKMEQEIQRVRTEMLAEAANLPNGGQA